MQKLDEDFRLTISLYNISSVLFCGLWFMIAAGSAIYGWSDLHTVLAEGMSATHPAILYSFYCLFVPFSKSHVAVKVA